MTLEYRLFEEGDQSDIIRLFALSFNKEMDPMYWKWRYKDNLVKRNYINLVMDGDVMAAHYALSASRLFVNGKGVNSGLSMTTMTHPDYRGKRLFTQSAEDLYNKCKNYLDVVYGIPNENSIKGFTKYLDFKVIQEIRGFELKSPELVEIIESNNCQEIDRFDDRFDKLMDSAVNKYKIILSRSSQYLNWRFLDNPQNDYEVICYEEDDELLGYVVTKLFNGNNTICGDIVDVVALNEKVFTVLIQMACNKLVRQNVSVIKVWMNDKNYISSLLVMGFVAGEEVYNFIVRNNSTLNDDLLMDFDNWYLTMSDIDIF